MGRTSSAPELYAVVPVKGQTAIPEKAKRVRPRSQNLISREVLRRHDGVGRVVEGRPHRGGGGPVSEHQVAGIVEQSGGDAEACGVGVPDGGIGAVDETEAAGGEEVEGSTEVDRSGCAGGVDGRPDGYAAGEEDSDNEGRRGSGWVGRKETQREGVVGRGPGGVVWVGGVEGRARCYCDS